uniref:GIY-YIG domain-containing protein n=1 Tax=Biomphalaria glabrata TaxID=6526 RepID=A0A2C9KNE6_BIOGL
MEKNCYADDFEDNKYDLAENFSQLHIPKNVNQRDETLKLVGRGEFWRNKFSPFFNAEMVLYEISCLCGYIYYGETSNSLRVALGDIESKIRNKSSKKRRVEEHFGTGKCIFDNAFIKIKDYEECTDTRIQKKRYYKIEATKSLNIQTPRKRDIMPHNLKQEKLEK